MRHPTRYDRRPADAATAELVMPRVSVNPRSTFTGTVRQNKAKILGQTNSQYSVIVDPTGASGDSSNNYATFVEGWLFPITGISAYGAAVWTGSAWVQLEGGGGGGGITTITSDDSSVTITDPTGPTTDLSVNFPSAGEPEVLAVPGVSGGPIQTISFNEAITFEAGGPPNTETIKLIYASFAITDGIPATYWVALADTSVYTIENDDSLDFQRPGFSNATSFTATGPGFITFKLALTGTGAPLIQVIAWSATILS